MILYQPPQKTKLDILYFDDDLLIVDKPTGLLTVPGRRPEHKDCLLSRIHKIHPEARIVHRLDMSTSGLLLLARNPETHRQLNKQFEQRQIVKTYLAVVTGMVAQISGTIELPLISADRGPCKRQTCANSFPGS